MTFFGERKEHQLGKQQNFMMKVERLQQSKSPSAVCVDLNFLFLFVWASLFHYVFSPFVSKVYILTLSNQVSELWIQAGTPLTAPVKQVQFPEYNRRSGLSLIIAE